MSPGAPQPRDRRGQLLDAAFTAFMATGYAKTSMSDIAREAGVSRPTLYRAFPTKEDIFRSVAERLHTQTHEAYLGAAAGIDGGTNRLAALAVTKLGAHIDIVTGSPHGQTLLEENQRIAGDLAAASNDRFQDVLADTFRRSGDLVLVPGRTPKSAARTIATLIDGWERRVVDRDSPLPRNWRHQLSADVEIVVCGLTRPG